LVIRGATEVTDSRHRADDHGAEGSLVNNLAAAKEEFAHMDMYYNAGHPGAAEPLYHVMIWYVSPQQAAALEQ